MWEPPFLAFPQDSLLNDCGPVAPLDYGGGFECLWHVSYSRTARLEAHPLPEWGWQAFYYTSRHKAHAFWGSHHTWTLDLSNYHQERNMTLKNSVVFFKKCILVVYSLGDSVCVRCIKIVKKAKFLPLSFWSLSCLLCLLLAFTPGCPDPHACLRQFPIPLFPGLTQLPMLHTRIHQHPSTCIHSESIHRSLYVCLTERPPWVLLLFITARIFWLPIICQALSQILSVDYLI